MEPISTAVAAFGAVKAGLTAGKELHSLAKELGKMCDACDEVNKDHNKKKNRQVLSVNEEALSTFVDKQRAKDLEAELREIVVYSRGHSAWHELLQLRAEIRRERKQAEIEARKLRAEKQEATLIIIAVALGGLLVIGLMLFVATRLAG